jgi:hypothetical protein
MKTEFRKMGGWVWQRLTILTGVLLLSALFAAAQPTTIEFINGLGTDIGRGFDLLKGQASSRIPLVNRAHAKLPGGQQVEFQLTKISSSLEMDQALGVDVSASGSFLVWSASAKASYLKEKKMNKYNLYYMIKVDVINPDDILSADPTLTVEAKNLLADASKLTQFHQAYGTHFVYGLVTGGQYFGIIEIETTSESNREEVEAKLSAGGLGWDFRANFSNKLKEVAQKNSLKIHEIIVGGSGMQPSANIDQMLAKAQNFPANVRTNPVPVKVILSPYTVFPAYSSIFTDLDLDRRYALLEVTLNYLDYTYLRDHIDYILNNQARFRFDPAKKVADLNKLRDQSRNIQFKLTALAATRDQIIDRSKPIPKLPESAQVFGANVMLPRLYKAYMANLTPVANIPMKDLFPLQGPIRGDSEMDGHRPKISLTAGLTIGNQGREIILAYNCKMEEDRSDWTTFFSEQKLQWKRNQVDFPNGIRVKSVYPATGNIYAQAGPDDHDRHWYPSKSQGLLSKAECISDVGGSEKGKIGCKFITFNPVTITFQHEEDYLNQPYVYDRASDVQVQILMRKAPPKPNLMIKPMNLQEFKKQLLIKKPVPKPISM